MPSNWREARHMTLTPLNLETTRRAARCELRGGHRDSGERVVRQFPAGMRELPICSRCRVPFGGPAHYWSSAKGGRAS